jgi:2-methylcitrate dehydratase PrpD
MSLGIRPSSDQHGAPGLTRSVAMWLTEFATADLEMEVRRAAALHILDTLAAMVSGTTLPAGRKILAYSAAAQDGSGHCQVVGQAKTVDVVSAARVNGMLAHADETDDSHQASLSHPGCAVIPAAFAAVQSTSSSGDDFVRSVVAGYELTARINLALGPEFRNAQGSRPSSHAIGGLFGASAAAALILGLDIAQVEDVLSYTSQLAAGSTVWLRDGEHVQKAFVFGGMPASNGVLAAKLVSEGLPGMPGAFDGAPNFLEVYSSNPDRQLLARRSRRPFAIEETNFKLHPVGSPAQSLVQAAERIAGVLDPAEIASIVLHLPPETVHVVQNPASSNLNAAFLVAATLIDSGLSFARAHDERSPKESPYVELASRCSFVGDPQLAGTRGGAVSIRLLSGPETSELVLTPLGTFGAPLTRDQVLSKARSLLQMRLTEAESEQLISAVCGNDVPKIGAITELIGHVTTDG